MSRPQETPAWPLSGLRVVEYARFVSGPYCARLLADAGAEVVKVEPPEGDESRRRGPFPDDRPDPEQSGLFLYLNAGKKGVTLDLQQPPQREAFLRLLEGADVLVANYHPTALEALGLGPASLRRRFPRLIITLITPFGLTGPYRHLKGDDLIALNMGGLAYATPGLPDQVNDPEAEPPLRPATYLSDFIAGVAGAIATLLALLQRRRDGQGRLVDISQHEGVASLLIWEVARASYLGERRPRYPPVQGGLAPNAYLPCKDGYVAVVAFSDHHWRALAAVMGHPDLADEEVFRTSYSRAAYWDALLPIILEWTMSHTGREILEMTQPRGIPCFPAYEVPQVVESEQVAHRGSLVELHQAGRAWRMPGLPFRSSSLPRRPPAPAPRLGQHNREVLGPAPGTGEGRG